MALCTVSPAGPIERNLMDLPAELIEHILSFATYDDIARLRLVSRHFDQCCQRLLNCGFLKVERYHAYCLKRVKSQLPRRESERRNHPLARHCDVLSAIETRLSLLGMTFMKYIDMNLCCFIPGRVIDEIYYVLRFIENNPNPPRVHDLLQELRDISSMAMEYFEEKIAPSLKSKLVSPTNVITVVTSSQNSYRLPSTSFSSTALVNSRSDSEVTKINSHVKKIQQTQNALKRVVTDLKGKMKDSSIAALRKELGDCKTRLKEYEKVISDQNQTIAEHRSELDDLKRRMSEYDDKLSTIVVTESSNSKIANREVDIKPPFLTISPVIEKQATKKLNSRKIQKLESEIHSKLHDNVDNKPQRLLRKRKPGNYADILKHPKIIK